MIQKILALVILSAYLSEAAFASEAPKFRDIFVSVLAETAPQIDPDAVIYETPDSLTHEIFDSSLSPLQNLAAIDNSFVQYQPHELFKLGQQSQRTSLGSDAIDNQLAKTPVTLVLVPGYLSEFASTPFAAESFSANSVLAQQWNATLRAFHGQNLASDVYYSLGHNSYFKDSLGNLISVASLDNKGQPLVRLVAFRFPKMQTLESVGTIGEVAAIYTRRLEKALAMLGQQLPNLVLVGHSRGTAVALDMLAKAHAAKKNWVHQVRGVVSLSGVVSGVHAADRIDIRGSDEWVTVQANRELLNSLKSGSNLNPFVLLGNLSSFLKFKRANTAIKLETTARLNYFFGASEIHHASYSGAEIVMDRLGEQLNQSGGGTKAHKLKIFISKTLAGLEGLRTREHLKWWQSNTVPTAGLKYYSIGATMTDPRRSNLDRSMVENSPNLQITSNDFKIGLKSYRSMMLEPSASSFNYDQVTSLHDGNVPLQRAMFWPKLLASLNPANQLETEFLGIVGVNHFALAHANVSGDTFQNPFPRTALLKSIAAKVSFDSQKK